MGTNNKLADIDLAELFLPWASCRIHKAITAEDAGRPTVRRRRPRPISSAVASLLLVLDDTAADQAPEVKQHAVFGPVLLGSTDGEPLVICRLAGAAVLTTHQDTESEMRPLCCYSDSVQIIGAEWSDLEPFVHYRYPITPLDPMCTFSLACQKDGTHHHHQHVHLRSVPMATTASSNSMFLATLQENPPPLLSLALTVHVEDPNHLQESQQPLLQACLKRQLVGLSIAWKEDTPITTVISLEFQKATYRLTVQSTAVQQRHARQLLYTVFPSTRITLLVDDESAKKQIKLPPPTTTATCIADLVPPTASPTTQLLLETFHCLLQQPTANVPRTYLLTGPPGVGKTYAVQTAVDEIRRFAACHLTVLQGSAVLAETGHAAAAIERYFVKAARTLVVPTTHIKQQQQPPSLAVIFLDECDALASDAVTVGTLGVLLDRISTDPAWRRIVVVAATNRINAIPASLRRPGRLDREIPLGPPNVQERRHMLQSLVTAAGTNSDSLELQLVADVCVGYVAADLAALVRRAALLGMTNASMNSINSNGAITAKLLMRAVEDVGASALRDAALSAPPGTVWDDIAGDPGGAKTLLRQAIEWPRTKRAAFQALGLAAPRGILLHGPPGCAKTTLARAAAGASGVAFLSLAPADVYASSYVGEAEAVVRRAFSMARSAAPCVLFFDEIDAVVGSTDGSGGHGMTRATSAEARVLSTFLNEMDGVDGSWEDGVLVLGATNRPWTLDAALLRPGRFDKVIYVPPPDAAGRHSILEMQSRDWMMEEEQPLDLDILVSDAVTGNMTGAEIVGACRQAAMRCLQDTLEAKTNGNNNVQPRMKHSYLREALDETPVLLSNPTVRLEFEAFEAHRSRT